jgi:hypothetical protein
MVIMRRISTALLIGLLTVLPVGCGKKGPTAAGPLTVVIVVESGGKGMTLRLDGADGAETTNPPADKSIRATLTKPGHVSVDASLFKSAPPLFAITLEIDNQKEVRLRFEGFTDVVLKELGPGGKEVGLGETILPGKHTYSVRGKAP